MIVAKNNKKYILLIILAVICLYNILNMLLLKNTHVGQIVRSLLRNQKTLTYNFNSSSTKYILQYNDFFNLTLCLKDKFENCPVKNCLVTDNSTLMPINNFDAIIFNDPGFYKKSSKKFQNIPRRNTQKYIFLSLESPVTYNITHSKNFYNWTISYRKDSDFYLPFGATKRRKSNFKISSKEIKSKKKLVAWLVSNCHTKGVNYRKNYARKLKRYIPVDVYGKCGDLTCPGRMSHECYHMLDQNYKFYLSFENSLCKDYITEKLFHVLAFTNMVPVVLGFADYKNMAPPNSYINVENFSSPKNLAEYLYKLSNNTEQYMKFFEWKKEYYVSFHRRAEVCCELCQRLHEPLTYSSYPNLSKWAWGENYEYCKF